jgi:hypothetical protein
VAIRNVGEYVKSQLTPVHPLPEFPVPNDFPFLLCIAPTFAWAVIWIYLRKTEKEIKTEYLISNIEYPKLKRWEISLRVTATVLATLAIADTAIHLGTPRLNASETTLKIARSFLVPPKWKEDFEELASKSFWPGQHLKTLLTHVELANYCVYELINWKVDKKIYNEFVLSPIVDSENDPELNWRRPLWEFFYPRIRKENSPGEAAKIVVRYLRERVTISIASSSPSKMPVSHWPTGIETIWRNQITDERGFERIYVATLRSVGIGARLNPEKNAEFWTGAEWMLAPRPLITTWVP